MTSKTIESVLAEARVFAPSQSFASSANVNSHQLADMHDLARRDPNEFWEVQAKSCHWFKPWDKVLEWKPPFARWFVGGKTNLSFNCLDRHCLNGLGNKRAIIWEGEPGEVRSLTYHELLVEVSKTANALLELGVKIGDRVVIYMPMVPEAAISMLACARIGATHSVIFGGFSAEAIKDRVNDARAKLIITADGGFRKGKPVRLKDNVDQAFRLGMPSVEKVLVLKRTGDPVEWDSLRDVWWHDLVVKQEIENAAAQLDSETPLFILYTSGTTGKPKGIVHTTAGYMVQTTFTSRVVFDLKPEDIFWCTADVGWITGHSYIVYGPLANGATIVMYEGSPDCPEKDRFWDIIERHRVTIFYTAPTAIRNFMRWGDQYLASHDLSSLRLLGTVGEPINPEAWMWYSKKIGNNKCPIVDTWWQTETGSIMIAPLPGVTTTTPGSATQPLPGIDAVVVDSDGNQCPDGVGGFLVIKKPWPSMLRGIFNDNERYQDQYWSQYPGWYFTGDGARRDKNGNFWVMGRVDDVLNVSGHRLGTAEVESALVAHPAVAEAAVVGAPDPIKGEGIHCFVTLCVGIEQTQTLGDELINHVASMIGAIARPQKVVFTAGLPKTRSGKIMRRLLRSMACGDGIKGDVTTLEDMSVLEKLRQEQ